MNNLSAEQLTSVDNAIDTKVNRLNNKGTIARIPGDWDFRSFGQTSVEMELVDATDKIFIKICNLFGVNPMIFQTNTTFSNVEQARADLITNLVLPMCCSLRDEENKMFLPAFGLNVSGKVQTRYTTDCDVSMCAELQDDNEKLATSLVNSWWLTINERRTLMSQEELVDPNADEILVPNNLVKLEDAIMPPETLQNTPYGSNGSSGANLSNSGANGAAPGKGNN
jgi:phage portal protein BeeE